MSGLEPDATHAATRVRVADCRTRILECVALRDGWGNLAGRVRQLGLPMPRFGRWVRSGESLLLRTRPQRLWMLGREAFPVEEPGCITLDQTGGIGALHVRGPLVSDLLATGCRLDLRRGMQPGDAAATLLAQVAVTLLALPDGYLILAGSSLVQHLHEWLEHQGVVSAPELDLGAVMVASAA